MHQHLCGDIRAFLQAKPHMYLYPRWVQLIFGHELFSTGGVKQTLLVLLVTIEC